MKQNNKLKRRVGRTLEGTLFEVSFLVLAILVWAFIVWLVNRSPENVPIHFDFQGRANAWGSPTVILFTCIMTTVIGGSLLVAAYFPNTINLPVEVKTPRQVMLAVRMARVLALETLLLTLVLALTTLGSAIGLVSGSSPFLLMGLVLLIMLTCIVFTVLVHKAK